MSAPAAPLWGLYDASDKLLATLRAPTSIDARRAFMERKNRKQVPAVPLHPDPVRRLS